MVVKKQPAKHWLDETINEELASTGGSVFLTKLVREEIPIKMGANGLNLGETIQELLNAEASDPNNDVVEITVSIGAELWRSLGGHSTR